MLQHPVIPKFNISEEFNKINGKRKNPKGKNRKLMILYTALRMTLNDHPQTMKSYGWLSFFNDMMWEREGGWGLERYHEHRVS